MNTAGHHIVLDTPHAELPPWDWSYDRTMALRSKIMESNPPIAKMPEVVYSGAFTLYGTMQCVPLTEVYGGLGMLLPVNSTTYGYSILYSDGTVSDTGTRIPAGRSIDAFAQPKMVVDRFGMVVVVAKATGNIYRMRQDGSALSTIGSVGVFATNAYLLFANDWDGGVLLGDQHSSNTPVITFYRVYGTSVNPIGTDNFSNTRFRDTQMFVPGFGRLFRRDGDLYDKDVSTRIGGVSGVNAGYGSDDPFFLSPLAPGIMFWGLSYNTATNFLNVGVHMDSGSVEQVEVGSGWYMLFGSSPTYGPHPRHSAMLPTGQLYMKCNGKISNGFHNVLVNPLTWDVEYTTTTYSSNYSYKRYGAYLLSNGLVAVVDQYSQYYTAGGYQSEVEILDFGFSRKYIPESLLNGPYGYNRT